MGKGYPWEEMPYEVVPVSVGRNISGKGFLCGRMTLGRDVHRKGWPWEGMLQGKDTCGTLLS